MFFNSFGAARVVFAFLIASLPSSRIFSSAAAIAASRFYLAMRFL
jgi:hypothetical protein